MTSVNSRNTSIDFFRFFFIVLICIYHYGIQSGPRFQHGYIGVEFFFIVSGIFLYKSFSKNKELDPLDYTLGRVKRLWGKYFVALVIYWLVYLCWMIMQNVDFSIGNYTMRLFSDSLMLQGTGLSFRGLCTPLWYVGALVVGSSLVFCLLSYNESLSLKVLLPFGSLLGYTYLTTQGTFDFYHAYTGGLFIPLLRAYSGIALGVIMCDIVNKKEAYLKANHLLIDIMAIVSFLLILVFVSVEFRVDGNNYSDNFLLLFIAVIVLACLIEGSLMQKLLKFNLCSSLGGITYEMLLIHSPIMIVVNYLRKFIPMSEWTGLIVYLVVVVISSYIFKFAYDWCTPLICKKRD
ncbi:MAG: acyltransferase [Bacteroidales bacterium]|nr:acyltransferase [Bacteroidales bacterium]